jgi:hypothetical protein
VVIPTLATGMAIPALDHGDVPETIDWLTAAARMCGCRKLVITAR